MTQKQIDIEKYMEDYKEFSLSELHAESIRITNEILRVNPEGYKSALGTNRKLAAVKRLIKKAKS